MVFEGFRCFVLPTVQDSQRGPRTQFNTTQYAPKEGATTAQESPKTAHERPKTAHEAPKIAQAGPKTASKRGSTNRPFEPPAPRGSQE
eukprot:6865578-Pyramimonas_sp.AAC.1